MIVTIIQFGHLLSSFETGGKLNPMKNATTNTTTNPVSARGPADHEVRDQIVAAATEHFSLYGYEKTTVSDLAKAIGFSKAYIYKFFESKQAIGEMICANCLREIGNEVKAAVDEAGRPPEKLRRMFKASTEASLRLFSQERKLYEIAASAATERWQATRIHEERIQKLLQDILQEGRQSGDFERKTPLDETTMAIYLVMRPYLNPLLLQHSFDYTEAAPALLSSLVLRSLSP
ncbi:MAG: tolC [Proteobacteria bacterium]|nr:tolC [Pseudomonadota bacterium]